MTLVVHAFELGPSGVSNHTAVTFVFAEISGLSLEGFNAQNVLWELEIEKLAAPHTEQRFRVRLPTSHGLEASFSCAAVAVTGVEPHEPGPDSVYSGTR